MNLAEALLAALPELPTQVIAHKNYKLNPDVVVREELDENQDPVVVIYISEKAWMLKVPPSQYQLLLLFNGERNFAEVAQAYLDQTGEEITEEQVKEFVLSSADTGLWYESAQERNITLSQKLSEERRKRIKKKSKFADLSHIVFQGFNPDEWLGRVHAKLWWVYTPWFTALTACLFAYMIWVWVDRWSEIGHDTLLYYTFTQKTGQDILEFWVLFLILAFFHESAHGLTCKHFGARVPNMGFQLIYLAPAFATEITEIWVRAGRRERILAIVAGIWMEAIFCAVATVIWAGTPPGSAAHEWAYKVMLITGIITLIVNLNPLIKLDGYYLLAEVVGISELKENSTAFVSGWVKKNIFRLPVDVLYVPSRRRFLYVPYALLSGVYSYVLLFAVSQFTYNLFSKWFAEWAFIPSGLVAWKIFHSRLSRGVAFMKSVYLDKRDHFRKALTLPRLAIAGSVLLVVILLPIFPRTVQAPLALEPAKKTVVRAKVAGLVEKVFVTENSVVNAGAALVKMRNTALRGEAAKASTDLQLARIKRTGAQIQYASLGPAQSELHRAEQVTATIENDIAELEPSAPFSGTVATPRVTDLEGRYVAAGATLMEIDDLTRLRARLFLPEYEVREVRVGAPVSLRLNSFFRSLTGSVDSIAVWPSEIPPGITPEVKYKGLKPPSFYVVEVSLANAGNLRPGMSGDAKIFVRRESLAAKGFEGIRDQIVRRVW